MESNNQFPQGLTYDDVLLLPGYTDFSRSEIDVSANLTKKIKLEIPFVSAPMDTVTEAELAIALANLGGIGIIHRNLSIKDQAEEVRRVKKSTPRSSTISQQASFGQGLLVGAAVGSTKGFEERVKALVNAKVDVIVVDSAHGFTKDIITAIKYIKKNYKNLEVIAGNIATGDAADELIKAGADALRVGMGPGAICTTRIVSGMGVPQITALTNVCKIANKKNVPVIADGGIKYSGDIVKALALGASTVMMGSFFAHSEEAPGKVYKLTRNEVPHRFQSIFDNSTKKTFKFKTYRGMGSEASMKEGAKIKSEGEFHGKDYYKERVLVAEGVEGFVPVKGKVKDLIDQALGGIKSGMYYVGSKNMKELKEKAQFIQVTQASLSESHPHGIIVSNTGKSYQ